jgi:hypothetical protein
MELDLADFSVEPMEDLDAPGFMDGFTWGTGTVATAVGVLEIAGVISLT